MTTNIVPAEAVIYAYQVGFGDCFLLRFIYSEKSHKHVLIDFGTTGLPQDVAADQMLVIAQDIKEKCGGVLDAVVATHRHADHISGFATKANGKGSGDIIRSMNPKVVIQPWTEQPDLPTDATAPRAARKQSLALQKMGLTAERVVQQLDAAPNSVNAELAARIRFVGEDNIANVSAVKNLASMSKKSVYTYHGAPSGLEGVLPGVTTHVLGPPTLAQTDSIRQQRAKDPNEFWQLHLNRMQADTLLIGKGGNLFPGHPFRSGGKLPMSSRWLASRLRDVRGEQLQQIVRILDDQMNNTSLILLFEAGGKKLLFPGDAQIENWRFALVNPTVNALLQDVDLYKVGHHGSLNATPRSMWGEFKNRGGAGKKGRLKTVMSTRPGKHGSDKSNTEVPRRTLLHALESESEMHSTHLLESGKLYEEIHLKL